MRQSGQSERTLYQQQGAMDRVTAQQAGALARTQLQQQGAMERVMAQQAGAEKRAQISADARITAAKKEMTPEQARIQWPNIEARFRSDQASLQEGIDLLDKYNLFGPIQGRKMSLGLGSKDELAAFGTVRQKLTQAVQARLQQVREAAGTGRAADSEKEGARVIGLLTGDPTIPQESLKAALKEFMKTTEKELFGTTPEANNASPVKIKSIKRIG